MAMRLADADLPTALALVAARLPRRTGWQYRNQPDDEHPGFTMWVVPASNRASPPVDIACGA